MLTQERLKEVLFYSPDTGLFSRRKPYRNPVGHRRGDGYILISVDYKRYLAHRLAWLYIFGRFPENIIDHIDNNPSNNAISNLRDTDQSVNQLNRSRLNMNNTSGFSGVNYENHVGKWRARVGNADFGYFKTLEEAVATRENFLAKVKS